MNEAFRLRRLNRDGGVNRRFHKFRYTAALRLGIIPEEFHDQLEFSFEGKRDTTVDGHNGNEAFIGTLQIDGRSFTDIVFIARAKSHGKYDFITFWPTSQHPDAHKSYTDPLVDTAMDGTPFDIELVASTMHLNFLENAGVSPATLMKLIYEDANENLRHSAERLASLLDEAVEISKQESERANSQKMRADQLEADAEALRQDADAERQKRVTLELQLQELMRAAFIAPPLGEKKTISQKILLVRAYEGIQGKYQQRAIILELGDGTTRSNNWSKGFSERLAYAKSLEGHLITTDVWGGYDGSRWFKNIYLA